MNSAREEQLEIPAVRASELRIERVPLDGLEKWPRNPKLHDLETLKGSIRRFGFVLPVMIDESSGRLVAGHGRQEALSQMRAAGEPPPRNVGVSDDGGWLVPVIRGNGFASEEEAEKYLIADNRLVEVGGWDSAELYEMLRGFEGPDLSAIGFTEVDVIKLQKLADPGQPVPKEVSFTASTVETNQECPKCKFRWSE